MIWSISDSPKVPVSLSDNSSFTSERASIPFASIPSIFLTILWAFSSNPFEANSSITLSMPILSSLSIATNKSDSFSWAPIISAIADKIFRLLIFIE